jgi:hypothetical protein
MSKILSGQRRYPEDNERWISGVSSRPYLSSDAGWCFTCFCGPQQVVRTSWSTRGYKCHPVFSKGTFHSGWDFKPISMPQYQSKYFEVSTRSGLQRRVRISCGQKQCPDYAPLVYSPCPWRQGTTVLCLHSWEPYNNTGLIVMCGGTLPDLCLSSRVTNEQSVGSTLEQSTFDMLAKRASHHSHPLRWNSKTGLDEAQFSVYRQWLFGLSERDVRSP